MFSIGKVWTFIKCAWSSFLHQRQTPRPSWRESQHDEHAKEKKSEFRIQNRANKIDFSHLSYKTGVSASTTGTQVLGVLSQQLLRLNSTSRLLNRLLRSKRKQRSLERSSVLALKKSNPIRTRSTNKKGKKKDGGRKEELDISRMGEWLTDKRFLYS